MTTTIKGLPEGYKPGLEGVVAGTSAISEVDPDLDALVYRGYAAHELAEKGKFTEVAYLLLYGKLPTKEEWDFFRSSLAQERSVQPFIINILKQLPKGIDPMTALNIGISACQTVDPDRNSNDHNANIHKAKRLIAKTPTLIAAIERIRNGENPIPPDPKLHHGANFIYMLTGKAPDDELAKNFNATMILYAEHGYNASTFSGLVTASTLSDMHSAVVSAVGTLKGPLHGGANEKAIEMLLEIGDADPVVWLKEKLARKEKIMGFGHRVYKKQDSRAPLMKKLAGDTAKRLNDQKLFDLSCKVEEAIMQEKKLFPNVDFHCAVFYYLIGLPIEIYTPIFAMSRMVGWTAHIIEQHDNNRLIRPKCVYTGERDLPYVSLEQRSK